VSDEVAERLREAIRDHGPITFAEFMEVALYSPGGFYDQPPIGERGHFVTSPHVHPVFGELLAGGIRQMWETLDRPDPLSIVEVGAGDGTLAAQLLGQLAGLPVDYTAVERSAGARAALAELPMTVAASIETMATDLTGIVLANELLDNLPFHWVKRTKHGVVQICVDVSAGSFVKVEEPADDPELIEAIPVGLEPGQDAAVSLMALQFLDRLARVLRHGYAVLVDYGGEGPAGPVHGYRGHRVLADVLDEPGTADITAGVDFGPLLRRATDWGLQTIGPVSQRSALLALGFANWGNGQRDRQGVLLSRGEGAEAVRTFGDRSKASVLVDETGLGSLRWLALATKDLAWPAWLDEAAWRDERG
jgi:SAM-dependent MidA family methyltransferase